MIEPGTPIEFRESTRLGAPWFRGELVSDDGRRCTVLDRDGNERTLPASRVRVRVEAVSTRRACAPLPVGEPRTFTTARPQQLAEQAVVTLDRFDAAGLAPISEDEAVDLVREARAEIAAEDRPQPRRARVPRPDTHTSADDHVEEIVDGGDRSRRSPFSRPAPPIVRPSLEAILRAPPLRDPAYLAFVRTLPCAVCGAPPPSEPSHFGSRGMSQKTDDSRVVPSCREDHDAFHQTGRLRVRGRELSRVETERLFLAAQVDALTAWRKRELLFDARRSE